MLVLTHAWTKKWKLEFHSREIVLLEENLYNFEGKFLSFSFQKNLKFVNIQIFDENVNYIPGKF